MQARDDFRYAVDGSGRGFGSLSNRQRALRKGTQLGDWLRSLPVIHQEADNIFMHAGMSDAKNVGRSMRSINSEIGRFLQDNRERQVYNDLVWDRELVTSAYSEGSRGSTCQTRVPNILRTFDATRMFVGHTTVYSSSLAGRNQRDPLKLCDGKFYNTDVGISRWMRSEPRNLVLDISGGRTSSIRTVRTARLSRQLISDQELYAPEEFMTQVDPMSPNSQSQTYFNTMDPAVFNSIDATLYDFSFMFKEAIPLKDTDEKQKSAGSGSGSSSWDNDKYINYGFHTWSNTAQNDVFHSWSNDVFPIPLESPELLDPYFMSNPAVPKREDLIAKSLSYSLHEWFDTRAPSLPTADSDRDEDPLTAYLTVYPIVLLIVPCSLVVAFSIWTQKGFRCVKGACCVVTAVSKESMMNELTEATPGEHML
jgi:hypothetical protein